MSKKVELNLTIAAAVLLTLLLTGVFGLMMVNSFFPLKPPIEQISAKAHVIHTRNRAIVVEVRTYMRRNDDGDSPATRRTLYPEDGRGGGMVVEGGAIGPDETVLNENNTYSVMRSYAMPDYANGRWCSRADVLWWPIFSQREHEFRTKDVCFNVDEPR